MLESGAYVTVAEVAGTQKVNSSYVSRALRLTLIAPQIVEAILDERQPAHLTLAVLMKPFQVERRADGPSLPSVGVSDLFSP